MDATVLRVSKSEAPRGLPALASLLPNEMLPSPYRTLKRSACGGGIGVPPNERTRSPEKEEAVVALLSGVSPAPVVAVATSAACASSMPRQQRFRQRYVSLLFAVGAAVTAATTTAATTVATFGLLLEPRRARYPVHDLRVDQLLP